MQKVINVLALASFAVSAAVVTGATYVYLNKDALLAEAKAEAMAQIGDMVQGQLGDALFSGSSAGDELLPDLPDPTRIDETGAQPIPVIPFGI